MGWRKRTVLCCEWDFCLLCVERPWDGETRRDEAEEAQEGYDMGTHTVDSSRTA